MFKANAEALAFFRVEVGHTAFQQEVLNGTFSAADVVIGFLTGKIDLATVKQYAWNTAIAANPIGLLAVAAAGLGIAVKKTCDAYDRAVETIAGDSENIEDAAAKVEDLKKQIEELQQTDPAEWTDAYYWRLNTLKEALGEAEAQYAEFAEQQRIAQEEAEAAAAKAAEPAEIFRTATEQYANDACALAEKFWETYDGIYSKVTGWFGLFDEAKTSVETNVSKMMAAMQSQIDFNTSYTANLQALKEYGLGSLSEAFQSYGADGAAYAQAIVSAVEQAGGATTEQGQQIINGFWEINQKVSESQNELSQTMALMNGEFEGELASMNESYAAAIEGLNKSKEAKMYASDTFQAFLNGMNDRVPGILSRVKEIGSQITSSLQSGIGKVTVPVYIETQGSIPGHANGLDFVPYDNYLAYLHKGEAVLTAAEAKAWRSGSLQSAPDTGAAQSARGIVINQYIQTVPQTAADTAAATEAYFEQARWAIP